MSRLLRDRFLAHDGRHGWDLATGALVRVDDADDRAGEDHPPLPCLLEALDHGREGIPRAIAVNLPAGYPAAAALARAAADARHRGYVAMDVAVYRRFRTLLAEDLRERTLLLLAGPGTPDQAGLAALVDAAARSPRPHMLVTFRDGGAAGGAWQVREARPAYGRVPPGAVRRPPVPADVLQHLARAARAPEFLRAGRHAAAERLLREVAASLARRDAHGHAARTSLQLGRLLLGRGRAGDAERIFDGAAAAAERAQDEPLVTEARIWQVMARTDAAQLTAAESLCRALCAGDALAPPLRTWADAALVRVLLWQGRIGEADALELPAPPGAEELDEPVACWVGAMGVRLCLARDEMFAAGARARALVTRAQAAADPLALAVALGAQLRVLMAAGDLVLAEGCLSDLARSAREARVPLRTVGARIIWLDALRRAGREREADRLWRQLARFREAMPPLLRAALDERRTPPGPKGARPDAGTPRMPVTRGAGAGADATALIVLAQHEVRDEEAIRQVLERTAALLRCSRLELCTAEAGPSSTVLGVGTGLATVVGARVLEAGIPIGPDGSDRAGGGEIAVPVRLGPRLVGALAARWPIDRVPPPGAAAWLEIAAAVVAPRVEGLLGAARAAAQAATAIPELVGVSAAIIELRGAIARAAAAPFNVLVEGESGVGKELVARAIHHLSRRRERRFCDVNCAAIPDDLLESELFGHARGAFTGAVAERAGLFEEAHGGTLFLDEVADLSARAQAKLLRVLQQQEIRRVGESFSRPVDVRVVSAANRDLRAESAAGRFRQDLLYRLDVIRLRIPPLRERPEDVPVLAHHFWERAATGVGTTATLTHGVLSALARYHWPGNVRELQNVIAGLAVAAPARGRVPASVVPSVVSGATAVTSTRLAEARMQFERRFIEAALARAGGSRSRAARELGLSRQGLLKMMARLELGRSAES